MAGGVIEEFLISIGFTVDQKSNNDFKKTIDGVQKSFLNIGLGIAGAIAAITGFAVAVQQAGDKLGNITTGVDKFALSLYTTTKNARGLQTVMDAMGIKSLDDLKYINLMPEQRKQFMELRQLSDQLAPDQQTKEGLDDLRKLGFQFQKIQIELASVGLKFLGTIGRLMETPLFRRIPIAVDLIVNILGWMGNMIAGILGKHPLSGGIGGAVGLVGGALGGGGLAAAALASATAGAEAGAVGGPLGALIGGGIGLGIVGAGASAGVLLGTPAGIAAGGFLAERKNDIQKIFSSSGSFKEDVKKFKAYAIERAKANNIDPAILLALINQESGWNPRARSKVGAIGIGQFMPGTARKMGVDPLNPYSAIDGTARYLKNALIHFHGNVGSALASYNAGFGAVDKYHGVPPYRETQNYVHSIISQADKLRPVIIHINGAQHPDKVAHAVKRTLQANGSGVG